MPSRLKRCLSLKDIRIGFEFEFGSKVLDKKYGTAAALRSRPLRISLGSLGEDALRYELRTQPTPACNAPEVLKNCTAFMNSVSARTLAKDGLHINVSMVDNRLNLMVNPLMVWILAKPRLWALRFGRTRSWACRLPVHYTQPELLEFISASSPSWNRLAINFSHFRPRSAPRKSRVEFRYPGGINYHRRLPILKSCLRTIIEAFASSAGCRIIENSQKSTVKRIRSAKATSAPCLPLHQDSFPKCRRTPRQSTSQR
jgi:hypothetical protein